ncbi:MAG: bacteriohemerythrin [Acetobacteraceae bacterium]|nr:bacteriohemerythrin [Pseudomonadota bacterium]
MTLMAWNDAFSVGVPSIDKEHQRLIGLLNALYDAVQSNQAKEKLGQVLDGLIAYTATHFKTEERYFAQTHYPDAERHSREHEELTRQVLEVQRRFKAGETATLSMEVMNFLKRWLVNHIQGSDRKYAPHLQSKGIK